MGNLNHDMNEWAPVFGVRLVEAARPEGVRIACGSVKEAHAALRMLQRFQAVVRASSAVADDLREAAQAVYWKLPVQEVDSWAIYGQRRSANTRLSASEIASKL